ncbi:hypothetical protein [Streptomyces sp. NPDC126503]|uniref:hypothetical protein n=1 Tax=Streptomyces sp. NPDC126503 TaxID=3155315 RepID=UPI0033208896
MPNPARSRDRSSRSGTTGRAERSGDAGRSGRSARRLLLVPALLTALLGSALPAGTALAATPAPPATAASAPAPEPTTTVTSAPAPEPSAPGSSTEPTTAPAPAEEPTTPTEPTPTADPCPVLPLTPLGAPGDPAGRATVESGGTACFTVTVEKPGLHRLLLSNGRPYPSLYSGENQVDCEDRAYRDTWCELAAGTYTLKITVGQGESAPVETGVSLVPLMDAPDCPAVPSTAYDAPLVTGTSAGPLSVLCHAFPAAPGERFTADLQRSDHAGAESWITDATGTRVCPAYSPDGGPGCVLPEGSGGYRVLAVVGDAEDGSAAPYTLKVRRLSEPVGCVSAPVTVYGSAPAAAAPGTECRTFTPATTGRYDVRAIRPTGGIQEMRVHAPDGSTACAPDSACVLTAGTTYTLLTDAAVRITDRASTEGCESGVSLGTAHRGTFAAPAEVDCLHLPVPRGAHLAILSDLDSDITVVDAEGTPLCEGTLRTGTCALAGTAPYRALVSAQYAGEAGGYGLAVHRTDVPGDCRAFPSGALTADPARAVLRTGEGVFADCLAIPADDHSASELVQIQQVSGSSRAEVSVVDTTGKQVCDLRSYYGAFATCDLTPGLAHTVLVQGRDVPGEFTLTRHDVTATARGCVPTPAVAVGGPSTGGVPAAPGTFLCHSVTTASAGDTLHLAVRDAQGTARQIVYDANGGAVCDYFAASCALTGSTRYQVLVQVPADKTAAPAYRLDALRIGTPAGPAPECVKVPDVSYGFGPLTGTLSEQRTAVCAVLPTGTGDRFDVRLSPAGTFQQMPTPRLYDQATLYQGCRGWHTGEGPRYDCGVAGDYPKAARPSTLVIGMPESPAQASTALRAEFSCRVHLCGLEQRTVGTVAPGTVGRGKVTMTVTGGALHSSHYVEVSNGGTFRARSTPVSVAADRRSMTVALDLTNAPLGTLHLSVFAHGVQYQRTPVTVVAPIRATAVPRISGTAVVGGKVTATSGTWSPAGESYAYQWRANGVAIGGATGSSYVVPATLQGKQLSVAVTARRTGHPVVTSVSAALLVKGVAPKPTRNPSFTGSARVGGKVTAAVGTWTPAPTSYGYQWRANGVAIGGATGSTYVIPAAHLGKKLTVTVTAHRTGHLSGSATSGYYTVAAGLAPKATSAPYVTGTVRVGRTLSVNRGVWTPAPSSYTYQWYANGRPVSGATKSWFTPTSAQRGTKLTVKVTAHRPGHTSGVAWTRATVTVTG